MVVMSFVGPGLVSSYSHYIYLLDICSLKSWTSENMIYMSAGDYTYRNTHKRRQLYLHNYRNTLRLLCNSVQRLRLTSKFSCFILCFHLLLNSIESWLLYVFLIIIFFYKKFRCILVKYNKNFSMMLT